MTTGVFRLTPLALLAGSILVAPGVHAAPAAEQVLAHTAGEVITRNYLRLATASDRLAERLVDLRETPTAGNVIAARAAWREARTYWETGEAALFGPVDTDGHDPAMDTWPLDHREIDQLVAGSAPLDVERVAGLDDDMKGFHAVEFLLWHQPAAEGRESAAKAAERLAGQPRQRRLLAALGADLADHAIALADAWRGSDGHARQLAEAGTPASRLYPAVRGALQELAQGLDGIVDEVAVEKLGEPLATGRPDAVESPYSRNSLKDMQGNIEGVRNLWLGSLDGVDSGLGLRALAAANGAEVAAVDRALLLAAGRLAAIGESDDGNGRLAFAEVIAGGSQTRDAQKPRIEAAMHAVQGLQARLAEALGEEE